MSQYSWSDIVFNPMLAFNIAALVGITVWQLVSGGYKKLVFG